MMAREQFGETIVNFEMSDLFDILVSCQAFNCFGHGMVNIDGRFFCNLKFELRGFMQF